VEVLDPSILKTGRPACHPIRLARSLRRRHWLRPRAQRAPAKRVRSVARPGIRDRRPGRRLSGVDLPRPFLAARAARDPERRAPGSWQRI